MSEQYSQLQIEKAAKNIRKRILKITLERNGCYLAQTCSSSEILASLYMNILNLSESKGPKIPGEFPGTPSKHNMDYLPGSAYNGSTDAPYDRLFISPAHYAAPVYSTLVEVGRLSEEALEFFNKDGYSMEMIGANHTPGFENAAGTLSQAISIASGTAYARKLKKQSGRIFVFMSDGELEEGQLWEAIQAAAFYKLDNLVLLVDINGQQVEGFTKNIMNIEPLEEKFKAFGAKTVKIDGHDVKELQEACQMREKGKPLVVLCYTNPTQGIPLLEHRKGQMHFIRFNEEESNEYLKFYQNM